MEQAYKEIAPRLKGLRDALDWDVAEMARQTGITPAEVERYESGTVEIPLGFLLKASQASGVELNTLIAGSEAHLTGHSLVRKGKGLAVDRRKDYDYKSLAYRFSGRKMEPFLITVPAKKPEEMTIKDLKAQIEVMRSQYVNTKKLETELHQRFTIPLASLIFTLVGVPLGLQPNRNSSSAGFALSLIIIFVYYSLMTMAGAIAQSGAMEPAYAVWIPNLVGMAAGAWLMYRASR